MGNTQVIGQAGEDAACQYLKKNCYKILARNFRRQCGEIDIIAQKKDIVAFVEVKTRKNADFGLPCEFVTKAKQQKLIQTAYNYIEESGIRANYSFDIMEAYHENGKIVRLNHIPNAFDLSQ